MQHVLTFLTLSMTFGANLSDGFLARLGIDPDILIIGLIAMVVTGLVAHRRLALIVCVALLAVGANIPEQTAAGIGFDPDLMLAALIALVTAPLAARHLG